MHWISQGAFYKWRFKCSGLEALKSIRMKGLEQWLSEYETIAAKLTRDNRVLKSLIDKKALAPTGKREASDCLVGEEHIPLVLPARPRVCCVLPITRSPKAYLKSIESRSALAIEIDLSLSAARVVRTVEQFEEIHGLPKAIRLDRGGEVQSTVF